MRGIFCVVIWLMWLGFLLLVWLLSRRKMSNLCVYLMTQDMVDVVVEAADMMIVVS